MLERITRLRDRRWANLAVTNLRILLGFAFLPAGLKKVLGQRFTEAANTGPFHEFLHAFYATGFLYRAVGAVQLVVAWLLMTQTYATLGAAVALPLFLFITVLCWSTGAYPTAVMTTLMMSGALALCLWEHEAFRPLLRTASSAQSVPAAEPASLLDRRLWQWCGQSIFALYLVSCALSGGVYRPRGADLGNPAFYTLVTIALMPLATWGWERRARK